MGKWKISKSYPNCILDDAGFSVADCPTPEIAAQIIREHNAHDGLVEALLEVKRALTSTSRELSSVTRREMAPVIPMIDAALAQAGETN